MNSIHSVHVQLQKHQFVFQSHLFIKELLNGSLERSNFVNFLQQDALYLEGDAELMKRFSKRCNELEIADFFKELATSNIGFEQMMQSHFFKVFVVKPATIKGNAIKDYLNYLECVVNTQDTLFVMAAFYPCFWMYAELGKYISAQSLLLENHPYAEWIETYSDESYIDFTNRYMLIFDQLLCKNEASMQEVIKIVDTVAQFECNFLSSCML